MIRLLTGIVVLLVACATLSMAQNGEGWKPIFDGKDMDGWQHVGPGDFVTDDGVLKTEGGMGLLWYTPEKNRRRADQGGVQDPSA